MKTRQYIEVLVV